MLILAVDTTTQTGSVALLRDGALLEQADMAPPAAHSARLLRAVDGLLTRHGHSIGDVEAFAVAAGPGSFTGIRIGLSAVKALAFASGRPVAPVSSLEALAAKAAGPEGALVAPVIDAKKGEVYAALFRRRAGAFAEVVAQGAYAPAAFLGLLPGGEAITFIGSGLDAYGRAVRDKLGPAAVFSSAPPFVAAEVGRLGTERLGRGGGVAADRVEPLYFRLSQAEEKR
jgi:tRNA threonylcarbamoyladenosine biosynthesis protein TsaB